MSAKLFGSGSNRFFFKDKDGNGVKCSSMYLSDRKQVAIPEIAITEFASHCRKRKVAMKSVAYELVLAKNKEFTAEDMSSERAKMEKELLKNKIMDSPEFKAGFAEYTKQFFANMKEMESE